MSPCTDPVRNTNRSNFYIEPKSNYVPMSTKNQGPVKAFDPVQEYESFNNEKKKKKNSVIFADEVIDPQY